MRQMEMEEYNSLKLNLEILIKTSLENSNIKQDEKKSLNELLNILKKDYSYEKRLNFKGSITRMIVDCLEIEDSLGDSIIKFDNNIS